MGTMKRAIVAAAAAALPRSAQAAEERAEWSPPTEPPHQSSQEAAAPGPAPPRGRRGSLRTTEALGCGNVGMSMGGGVAVLLPLYGFEAGVGLGDSVDVVARFETVLGVFHYPHLGLRWMPFDFGDWRLGTQLLAHYSFFGIKTDQLNFTSTFYSSVEVGVSGGVTDETDLVLGVGGEIDFFKVEVIDDERQVNEAFAWDATVARIAAVSAFGSDFHGYAQLKLRVPTETFVFEAQELYVIPMLEIGGTWTF
jgi:hypothetical protein